jgi:cytochrome c-type biogenesis protein CcmH
MDPNCAMTQDSSRGLPAGKIMLVLAGFALAFAIGYSVSHDRPNSPPPSTASATQSAVPKSIEALEQKANASPKNAAAWQALGLAYFEQELFDDAVRAYAKASEIYPAKAILWSALGEARIMANRTDPMPAEAVANFQRAISLDPKDPRARYFLAVKRDIDGDHTGAVADWLTLLADTPADAPWRSDLVRTIEQVGKINRIDVAAKLAAAESKAPRPPIAARAMSGPSAADLSAAASIPPREQNRMAEEMVARLEQRLASKPGNLEGWIMLMRSRMTLGQPDKASAALKAALAANPAQAAQLRQQADILGVR